MKTIIIALISLFASVSFAKTYGTGGCGLGTLVLGQSGNQILVATTNGTGSQTFAIISGTSNCTEGGRVTQQVPMFIEINKAALAKDAARGEGETVAGLAQLMGCDAKNFGSALKSNYNQIFVDTNMQPAAIETGINSMISTNKAQACGA